MEAAVETLLGSARLARIPRSRLFPSRIEPWNLSDRRKAAKEILFRVLSERVYR